MTIVFGTGHRPEDFDIDDESLRELIAEAINIHPRPMEVAICGMASGFDLAWGVEAYNQGLEVWSVRPWAGHRPRLVDRPRYEFIEEIAAKHVITNDSLSYPGPWVYHIRNEWMVDNADEGLSLWSGKKEGGTWACLEYARLSNKEVTNIYP